MRNKFYRLIGRACVYALPVLAFLPAGVNAQCGNFTYGYPNNNPWTQNGTGYAIGSGTFTYSPTFCGAYNYATMPLGCTLSDDNWCADFDFVYTARANYGVAHTLLAFTENTNNSWNITPGFSVSSNDGIEVYINCAANAAAGTETLHARSKESSTPGTPTNGITIAAGNTYYLRLQRLSLTQGMVSVFSNSARTTLIAAECFAINSNVTGLDILQQGCIPQGSWYRSMTGTVSNLNVTEATPGITGLPASVCAGTSNGTICVNAVCGASYNWTATNGTTITSGQGTTCVGITWGSSNTTVTCTMSFPGNACTLVQSAGMTVNPLPTANAGSNITLCCGTIWYVGNGTGTASGGTAPYTFSWSPPTHLSCTTCATPQLDICTLWSLGESVTYTLTVTDANGCVGTSTVNVTRPSVSCRFAADGSAVEDEPEHSGISIAPNPATGNFTVWFENPDVQHDVEVIDMLGQVIYSSNGINAASQVIDLTGQPKGVYIVRSKENGRTYNQRVIIQ